MEPLELDAVAARYAQLTALKMRIKIGNPPNKTDLLGRVETRLSALRAEYPNLRVNPTPDQIAAAEELASRESQRLASAARDLTDEELMRVRDGEVAMNGEALETGDLDEPSADNPVAPLSTQFKQQSNVAIPPTPEPEEDPSTWQKVKTWLTS